MHRIRDSSTGSLVNKNIVGIGNLGKSSSNINGASGIVGHPNEKGKFITYNHTLSNENNDHSNGTLPQGNKSNNNLHRITTQQEKLTQ